MGNQVMGKFRKNRYQGFSEDQVDYLNDKWLLINKNELVDLKRFADSYNISEPEAKKFIDFMDLDKTGKVDQYKFKVGAAILCQSPPEETAKLLFSIYDFDGDGFLGPSDVKVFTKSFMCGLNYFDEIPDPSDAEVDEKVKSLMIKWDHQDQDGKLSPEEFKAMLKKDPDVLRMQFEYGFITKAELSLEETDYNDIDTDLEAEMERRNVDRDERIERIKNGIEHNETKTGVEEVGLEDTVDNSVPPWLTKVADQAPSWYQKTPESNCPPNAYLDLEYVYGFRCHDTRNNLRYGDKGQIVYHTAGVGIVMDSEKMTQRHFLEHSDDITGLDIYENMVLTGQHGITPMLMVWDINTFRLICVWKDQLKNGIANVSFSNNGTLVAAVAMDDDHTIAIYDIAKGIAYRKDPKNPDFGLVALGKMSKREVFDIKFQPGDDVIVVACMKEVNLITWKDGGILSERTIWQDQKPQAALAIAFIDGYSITGMFSGQFFVWKDNQLDRTVKAHAQPVQALWTRTAGRGIISSTKRGIIFIWDQTLTKQYEIDARDLGLPLVFPPGPAITSVCESPEGKILFGTRRSEIVEVQPFKQGQQPVSKLLMQGHFSGELWGLAVHPSNLTFFTVGEDEMLAQWDAKNKRIIRAVDAQYAAKNCHVSPNGKFLAIGAMSGRVSIFDPNSLKKIQEINEVIDPDKETLSEVKFSPNSEILAVAYCPPVSTIVFYSSKNWKRINEIKDIPARVMMMDFSVDGKYIQTSLGNNDIMFFTVASASVLQSGESILKEEKWATFTNIFGWATQGIWPKCSSGSDINMTDRSKDGTLLAAADDFGKVKLFKFPCPVPSSGFGKYTGHSSYVCSVRFTFDSQYIISVGGDELSIFQWRLDSSPTKLNVDHSKDPPPEEEQQGQALFEEGAIEKGDTAMATKPFLGEVKASIPSWYKPNAKRDNVLPKGSLSLYHAMGFRYFYILDECRDMCALTDKGTLVFVTAALGVEMDMKTQVQSFFNKHEEDIVSFAIAPSRKIAATGQMAQAGKAKCIDIFVWDIEKKEQVAHFNDFHLRAIVLLRFSPDGTLLLSVGQDDDNSLAIHDWQANRLIATSNIDKAKVNGAAWASNDEFCTVGNKHIKFWKLNGRNALGKMGQAGGKFESQFAVCYAFKNSICVSGSGEGNLFVWKGGSADKGIPAHPGGKVQCLVMDDEKGVLYSGGMDGKVNSWTYTGGTLVKAAEIVDLNKNALFKPGITAMDLQPKTGMFLLGTASAQIFTYEPGNKKITLVQQGHFGDELWAACASPNSHLVVTAGADNTVRVWDIDKRRMVIASKPFENDIRAVDWASNNKFLVCGDYKGFIYLLDPNTLEVKDTGKTKFTTMPQRQSTYWIEDVKISPDCKRCAFGAHGAASHVEVWEIAFPKFGKHREINAGLTSALLHIDWSTDSSIAVVNSQAYELKFVDINAGKNARSSGCKDMEFATWTCKLGFPVQGIFPGADYSDVNTVCRSQSKKYLATGEDTQKVVLMKYPVVVDKQKRKEYVGHSSHVTRVRFTFDDSFLISVGGLDKSLIIWKTDFGAEPAADLTKECAEEGADDVDVPQEKTKKHVEPPPEEAKDPDDIFDKEKFDKGDQFMAVKPWMGAIKEPSPPFYDDKKNGHKPPKCALEIEYVYGYRTKDMRNNLYYLASGKVLYNAAALGIVLDLETNTQTFFDKHEDDITAIDLSPDRTTVATGELGAKPNLFVWNADTKEVKCSFKGKLTKGVIALAFSPSGKRLVGGAIDVDHYLAVFDVSGAGSVVWTDKGGPDTIIDLRFTTDDSFTTIGVKHYYCWTLNNGTIKKDRGQFGDKACNKLSGIGVNGADTICGASDGSVQVWKGTQLSKELPTHHSASCDAIGISADNVFTGGRDGMVLVFDKTYNKVTEIDCKKLLETSVLPGLRAIFVHPTQPLILLGTLGSEIYEIGFNTPKITAATQFTIKKEAMKGHFCPNLTWTNEVWGLDIFKNDPNLFVTCSDDGTFRVWNAAERKMVSVGKCTFDKDGLPEKPDHGTGDFQDKCKARCVSVDPKGNGFVVGMKDGTVRIFDGQLKQTKIFKKAQEWISDITFSPDGTVMVYGSHDNAMYAQKWPDLKPVGKGPMKKHSSYITHFDFSCDGVNLHSTCGAYELLFWDVAQGKQLPGGASALKDEKWYTWTVTLGWPVQGIWPECADGTDINAVDRSHATLDGKNDPKTSYSLLASGDDFSKVRILRYPSIKKSSEAVEGHGHSSHVTNVKFSLDDKRIFSTGGEDQCVIQWLVSKK